MEDAVCHFSFLYYFLPFGTECQTESVWETEARRGDPGPDTALRVDPVYIDRFRTAAAASR